MKNCIEGGYLRWINNHHIRSTGILFVLCQLASCLASAQQFRIFVPATIDLGLHFAAIEKDSASGWMQRPGTTVHVKTGAGLNWMGRAGFWAEGGVLLNTYSFDSPREEYSITNQSWSFLLSPYVLVPLREDLGTSLHVGSAIGWTYHLRDARSYSGSGYEIRSRAFGPRAFTISPELGITNIMGRTSVSVLLTYCYQNLDNPTLVTEIIDDGGEFRAEGKGDYLALRIRLGFELGKHKEPRSNFVSPPQEGDEFAHRQNDVIQRMETKRKFVTLVIRDSGEIDDDSISVAVNGQYLLTHYSLERRPKKIRVPLEVGENQLTIFAHNEGRVPPNTANAWIRRGFRRTRFPVSTSLERNASLVIVSR